MGRGWSDPAPFLFEEEMPKVRLPKELPRWYELSDPSEEVIRVPKGCKGGKKGGKKK
jgi:hypothetical protein